MRPILEFQDAGTEETLGSQTRIFEATEPGTGEPAPAAPKRTP